MAKNIYSLVLNDEIIDMIDNVAYKNGVSRSTLINGILAEYVGYETAEKRIKSIFSAIDAIIMGERRMRLLEQNRDSSLSIISALNYKYSPRITYSVEFAPEGDTLGNLVISYRTSKAELISSIENFFATWIALEHGYLENKPKYFVGDGKLKRSLRFFKKDVSAEDVANLIADYVRAVDKLLNAYIAEDESLRDDLLKERFLALDAVKRI